MEMLRFVINSFSFVGFSFFLCNLLWYLFSLSGVIVLGCNCLGKVVVWPNRDDLRFVFKSF